MSSPDDTRPSASSDSLGQPHQSQTALAPKGCSALELLPVELQTQILSDLDFPSLKSAILTCSALHAVFLGNEVRISTRMVENDEGLKDVLREAGGFVQATIIGATTETLEVDEYALWDLLSDYI